MQLNLSADQEFRLTQLAVSTGTDPESVVKQAIEKVLDEDARFRAAVLEGKAYADRGEFLEQEEMDQLLKHLLQS